MWTASQQHPEPPNQNAATVYVAVHVDQMLAIPMTWTGGAEWKTWAVMVDSGVTDDMFVF